MSALEVITDRKAEDEAILLMLRQRITNKEIASRLGLSIYQLHHRIYEDLKTKRPPVKVKELKHINLYMDKGIVDSARAVAKKEGLSLNQYVGRMIIDAVEKRGYAGSSGLSGRRTTK